MQRRLVNDENMKKLLLLLVLPFLGFACKEDGQKSILFEMTYEVDFEVPAGLNTIEDHFFVFQNQTSILDSLLKFHGYTREDISEVNPQIAQLTSIFSGEEYDFVRELSLYLYVDEVDGRRSEAFWRPSVPLNTGGILEIPGTLINAQDFFFEPKFNYELRLDTRQFTDTFIGTRLRISFVVRGG